MPSLPALDAANIPYEIRWTPNRRRQKLSFDLQHARLLIDLPPGAPWSEVERFVHEKLPWIQANFQRVLQQQRFQQEFWQAFDEGQLHILGTCFKVHVKRSGRPQLLVAEQKVHLVTRLDPARHSLRAVLQEALPSPLASDYLQARTFHWAAQTRSHINQVRIKSHTSKWGSCSSKRNINLNWHLIFLSPTLIDYVIIHELMHLREMNHSKAFWREVARYYPDYQRARAALRRQQGVIGLMEAGDPQG